MRIRFNVIQVAQPAHWVIPDPVFDDRFGFDEGRAITLAGGLNTGADPSQGTEP